MTTATVINNYQGNEKISKLIEVITVIIIMIYPTHTFLFIRLLIPFPSSSYSWFTICTCTVCMPNLSIALKHESGTLLMWCIKKKKMCGIFKEKSNQFFKLLNMFCHFDRYDSK